jgi:hypothetical protein
MADFNNFDAATALMAEMELPDRVRAQYRADAEHAHRSAFAKHLEGRPNDVAGALAAGQRAVDDYTRIVRKLLDDAGRSDISITPLN